MMFLSGLVLSLLLFAGASVEELKDDVTGVSTREAIARGEAAKALQIMEARAFRAEKNADWVETSNAHREASYAARMSGQLQKAVSYGDKALQAAEKTKHPGLQSQAILQLTLSYRFVGDRGKAREWIKRGIEITKQIQFAGVGTPWRPCFFENWARTCCASESRKRLLSTCPDPGRF
ncbi:MAG: tetratricopeptide repeat protein [Deltaproteobacteria bacterium]|nr:tetratricopeptide repeat protein [Deltaproteobacteria bacterium]